MSLLNKARNGDKKNVVYSDKLNGKIADIMNWETDDRVEKTRVQAPDIEAPIMPKKWHL